MVKSPWRWFGLAAAMLLFAAASVTRADPDLWGHLRFGLDTLHSRHLTAVDPYSFTQDVPWVNHEWLSELQMGVAYTAAGPGGLAILKGALVTTAFLLVWAALDRVRLGPKIVASLLAIMGTLHMWATIRPQIWSLLGFALLSRILVSARRADLLWLPLVFAIWANCHGGWIVGLAVLGLWGLLSVLLDPRDLPQWSAVVVACVAATLANPYGWGLWLFMARTVRMSRSIAEWGPLWGTPVLNWAPWFAASCAAVLTLWPNPALDTIKKLRTVLVLAMLAFASARVMRVESLFICASAILLSPWMASRWPARSRERHVEPLERPVAWSASLVALGFAAFFFSRSLACIRVFGDWTPDATVGRVLEQAEAGRLVTFFDWGEYAIWHVGGRLRVSMDGRRETVYSQARLEEYDAVLAAAPAGIAALSAWNAEYVWLPARFKATKGWLQSHGYRIDVDGARSYVAVRADLPLLRPQALTSRADCFPE